MYGLLTREEFRKKSQLKSFLSYYVILTGVEGAQVHFHISGGEPAVRMLRGDHTC